MIVLLSHTAVLTLINPLDTVADWKALVPFHRQYSWLEHRFMISSPLGRLEKAPTRVKADFRLRSCICTSDGKPETSMFPGWVDVDL